MGAPEQAEKRREHFALAKAPDWKYTPDKPNRGVPVPYWTIAYFDKAKNTAPSADGRDNEYFIARSRAPISNGGEAGKGGGVLSGAYMDEFEPKEWSDTLIIEGSGAVFQGHMGTINKGNAPAKVYTSMNPDQAIADKACWEQLKTNIAALGVTSKDRLSDDTTGCLKDMVSGAWGTISGDVAAVGDMLGSIWNGVKSFVSDPMGAVDGLKQFGAQAYEAGKQVVDLIQGLRDGSITMDDLLDFAADMLQDQLCDKAAEIEEMVKQGKGCEAIGVLLGQAAEAAAVAAATALTGGAAGGAAVAAGGSTKFAKAAKLLREAGVEAKDGLRKAIQKLKDLKKKRKEAPHGEGGPHLPKDPKTTDSSTPGDGNPQLPCPDCPGVAHPVNPILGCKVLASDLDLDFDLPGPLAWPWKRTYVSNNPTTGWLGQGWTLPISRQIRARRTPRGEKLALVDDFGREILFPPLPPGTSHYNEFEKITLSALDEAHLELRGNDGEQRFIFGGLAPVGKGRSRRYVLQAVVDRNGNRVQIFHDEHGLPTHAVDSAGRTLIFDFQAFVAPSGRGAGASSPRLVRIELLAEGMNQRASLVTYGYDAEGNLATVTDRAGRVARRFEYSHHMLTAHTDAGGLRASYVYDVEAPRGRILRSESNQGERYEFEYLSGRTHVTDQLGREEIYEYNDHKEWTGFVDALGGRTTHELDAFGGVLAVTDPAGRTTRYAYDAQGRPTRVEEPGATGLDTLVSSIGYDPDLGLPSSVTEPEGATTRYGYDERGNLIEVIDALGHSTRLQYDGRGLPVAITDATGKTKHLSYNIAGQVTRYTDCSGRTTEFGYDAWGYPNALTDALGQTTVYRHDAMGRLLEVRHPDGGSERYQYDPSGRLTGYIDPMGVRTEYDLAPDGRPLERRDAMGGKLRYEYDGARRLSALYNENGSRYDLGYDALDRLIEETGFDGRYVRYRYDPAGVVLGKLELGCLSTQQRLDHRLQSQQSQGDQQRRPAEDVTLLPPKRSTPTFEDPWGLGLDDEIGNRNPQPGHAIVTRYERDAAGRLTHKLVTGRVLDLQGQSQPQHRSTRYRYDRAGRVLEAVNDAGSRSAFTYSALGQVLTEQRVGQALESTLKYEYDALGNRMAVELPDGRRLNWMTYGSGHLHQVNLDGRVICDIERDGLHREIGRSQGALQTLYQYDRRGRLVAQDAWRDPDVRSERIDQRQGNPKTVMVNVSTAMGTPWLSKRYHYDQGGNLSGRFDGHRGLSSYEYDPIGRLLMARQQHLTERFAFDPASNMWPLEGNTNTAASGGLIRNNRVEVFEDKRYRYDTHGNLIEKKIGAHTVMHFSWDVEHRLVQSKVVRHGTVQIADCAYDAFGRRIEKKDAFGRTLFTWDGNRLLSEERGRKQTLYIYEADGFSPLAQVVDDEVHLASRAAETPPKAEAEDNENDHWNPKKSRTDFSSDMQRMRKELKEKIAGLAPASGKSPSADIDRPRDSVSMHSQIYYYHVDHIGTPYELTDAAGEITWSANYKAWGNTWKVEHAPNPAPRSEHPDRASDVSSEQNLRFPGQYFDADTGLHYNRFRYYDPEIGRFISQDPIGLAGGLNAYQYAPNPTGWTDALGLKCTKEIRANMKKAGMLLKGHAAHHVIPESVWNGLSSECQGKLGLDLNSAYNAIALPCSHESKRKRGRNTQTAVHDSNHRNYNAAVKDRLEGICGSLSGSDARRAMFGYINELKNQLTDGTTPFTKFGKLR